MRRIIATIGLLLLMLAACEPIGAQSNPRKHTAISNHRCTSIGKKATDQNGNVVICTKHKYENNAHWRVLVVKK